VRLGSVLPAHLRRFAVRTRQALVAGLFWATGVPPHLERTVVRPWATPHVLVELSPRPRYERPPSMSSGKAELPGRVPPSTQTVLPWCRNVDLLSIAYALRPRLRPDYP